MKKTVLITGASKGIGHALAQKMIDDNHFVIGTSRDGKIDGLGGDQFQPMALDLADQSSIAKAHEEIMKGYKKIDILVNNAGVGPDLGTAQPERATFDMTFNVNVTGTVFFTEPLIDRISENGMIINISSKMGAIDVCRSADSVAYRMSKSALNMYTKILANRLAGRAKVATVHPGWVKTTIMAGNLEHAPLTTAQSAAGIMDFINGGFESGVFWNVESGGALPW